MSAEEALAGDVEAKLQLEDPQPAWQDVTALLGSAAKELKVGQLVHAEDFNLFDSMSALELMDPKMDSGMLVNGQPPQSIASRLEAGAITLEFSSTRDVLATIDELFRCEAGWLNGLPLAQTLLSCMYLHKEAVRALVEKLVPLDGSLNSLDIASAVRDNAATSAKGTLHLVMCAVCVSLMKTGNQIREAVLRADIYEEEDFSPGNGFELGIVDVLSTEAVDGMLQVAQDRVEAILNLQKAATASKKASKKKHGKKGGGSSATNAGNAGSTGAGEDALELLYPNARVGALLCEMLLRRIRWRRSMLSIFGDMGAAEGTLSLPRWSDQFTKARELLQAISTEQLEMDAECFSGKPIGFDKTISRLLLSGAPPRQVKIPTTDEALDIQRKLVSEMIEICSPGEWSGMEDLRIFLSDFSRQRPTIVPRSYAVLFLYADKKIFGKYNFMEWLSASMVMNGVPTVLLSTQEGVMYSSRVIETLYESLKVYLHNRSRQRARIEYLFEEWAVLQLEATVVDEKFTVEMDIPKASYPRYFTAWSLEEVVLLMIQYVVLGLELDLYAPSEYGTVFWYLDYLHGSRLQNLNVTWSFVERMKQMVPPHHRPSSAGTASNHSHSNTPPPTPQQSSGANSASKHPKRAKGKPKKQHNHNDAGAQSEAEPLEPVDPTKTRFLREIAYSEMQRSLMRAYFQMFSALEREELVRVRQPTYSSPSIRFEHRFATFRTIHFPAALVFEDFSKNSDFSPFQLDLIYRSAEECYKVARSHGEALILDEDTNSAFVSANNEAATTKRVRGDEVEAMLRVCISNCDNLARHMQPASGTGNGKSRKANKAATSNSASKSVLPQAQFDFSIHPHFPVIVFPEHQK